jgi:HD-GYP domain-containing protein (c-di-GMP phosphodiesterase class II)
LTSDEIQFIELAAELHDVGKIGVRESVLLKPARLDEQEYDHLMQHMAIGARILEPLLKNAPLVIDVVRSHHERFDGSGRPDALAGNEIPLLGRIVSLADAFDAMTSARPYRKAMPLEEAVAEIDRCSGTQFDPVVVAAFHRAYPALEGLPIETPAKVLHRLPEGVASGTVRTA